MNIALILSGGTGTRMGTDIPKQYIGVDGRPIISYVLDTFETHEMIERIQIVADEGWHDLISQYAGKKLAGFSRPGANRQCSILNGLADILAYADPEDHVIIQDAARPLVGSTTITEILKTLDHHEAVTPILPLKDTIYLYENGIFTGTAERAKLAAGQAPEGFLLGRYYEAVKGLLPDRILYITGSLQAALEAGMDAVPIPGDEGNFKITTMADLEKFRQIIQQRVSSKSL